MVPQWFAMGSAVHGGCTVILKKSFSASKFWPDVVKYKVTVGQYIGEIARFLLGKLNYKLEPVCCKKRPKKVQTKFRK